MRWMFKVFHKVSNRVYTVYGINGVRFVVWDPQEQLWLWLEMTECEPVEEL